RQSRLTDLLDESLSTKPVSNQICNRYDLDLAVTGKLDQIRHSRHGAVLFHDFAYHTGGEECLCGGQVQPLLGFAPPDLSYTQPSRARKGKMCPGRARSLGLVLGSIAVRTVCARSKAEMPVETFRRASIVTQKAVPYDDVLLWSETMSGICNSSSRCPVIGRHMRPRPCVAMKLMASGVTFSAAIMRSPSFSRSSSSTMMTIRPSWVSLMASSIVANCISFAQEILDVFRQDVEFQVHWIAGFGSLQVCVLECMRNDCD